MRKPVTASALGNASTPEWPSPDTCVTHMQLGGPSARFASVGMTPFSLLTFRLANRALQES